MITLEHLNIVIKDMQETLKFYKAAFPHWRIRDKGAYEWHGHFKNWLHFGDDFNYLSLNDNGKDEIRDATSHQVGLSHFGFVVNNVEALNQRMQQAGFEIDAKGSEHPHRKNVYYVDPNGFEVEFVEYLSDVPELRNSNIA